MEIRRKILNDMYCHSELRKAIAFSLFIKTRVKSSAVQRWSINKLHEITGVSASAVRKRIDTLKALGLIEFTGKNSRCLVFKSLKSIPLTGTSLFLISSLFQIKILKRMLMHRM